MKTQIQQTLIQHAIITIPGLNKQRSKCRCGWTETAFSSHGIEDKNTEHQAHHIASAVLATLKTPARADVVDAEIVGD